MKLKYYLRGIGIGMIVTTIILMITFAVHKDQPLTDDEIRERAAELGMVMAEDLPVSDKLVDTDPAGQSADAEDGSVDSWTDPQGAQDDDAIDADGNDADDAAPADGQSGDAAQENDKKDDDTKQEVIEQVEISIVGGEYSNAVCKKLKKAGLIEDVDDFNKYLSDGGYDNQIQPGNYTIPKGADYEEIIRIITEKKR